MDNLLADTRNINEGPDTESVAGNQSEVSVGNGRRISVEPQRANGKRKC